MSAFTFLPSSVQYVLSFNLDATSHSSHSYGFIHLVLKYHPPPPLFSSPSVPFTLIIHHSLQLPIPPSSGHTGTVCCARELFAQFLLLSEDAASKKSSHFPYAVSRIPGHRTWRRTERREVRLKMRKQGPYSQQQLNPLSPLCCLLIFCREGHLPIAFCFPSCLSLWRRTEKTRIP